MIRCSNCKKKLQDSVEICPDCGTMVSTAANITTTATASASAGAGENRVMQTAHHSAEATNRVQWLFTPKRRYKKDGTPKTARMGDVPAYRIATTVLILTPILIKSISKQQVSLKESPAFNIGIIVIMVGLMIGVHLVEKQAKRRHPDYFREEE